MRQFSRSQNAVSHLVDVAGEGPWSTGALRAHGWSVGQIRAAVAAGRILRLRRGVYASATMTEDGAPSHQHLRAVLSRFGPRAVVSHGTAALLLGVWLPGKPPDLVHLTVSGAAERNRAGVRVHGSRLPASAVTVVDGLPITTVARTALDLARGASLGDAMIVVDSAAREILRLAGYDLAVLRSVHHRDELRPRAQGELRAAFADIWTWPGTVVARAAIDLVDPCSESPAESRSRAWMIEAKLAAPRTAFLVVGASGTVYYADFAWPDRRVLGEVDGFAKYGDTSEVQRARLRAERARQADLEDAGWTVVRWSTADPKPAVIARLRRALRE